MIFNIFKRKSFSNVLACDYLLHSLVFDLDAITPCCCMPHNGELNISLYDHKSYNDLVMKKIEIIKSINANSKHICRKCFHLKKLNLISFKDFTLENIFLSFEKICNLRCSYCYMSSYQIRKSIERSAIQKDITYNKIIDILNNINVNSINQIQLSGGEPFLSDHFDDIYLKLLHFSPKKFIINSNLTIYKDIIEIDEYRNNADDFHIVCSLDSSTSQIYKKIKGKDLFYNVISNIKKYTSIKNDLVHVKYIFCDANLSIQEIDNFFKLMKDIGVSHIIISSDYNKSFPYPPEQVNAMIYFAKQAIKYKFNIESFISCRIPELDSILQNYTK